MTSMSGTGSPRRRWPPGTSAVVLAVLLSSAASAFWLFAPTGKTEHSVGSVEQCGRGQASIGMHRCPPQATSISLSEQWTKDGRYVARETVRFRSGRTEVREYTRPAEAGRKSLVEEQPEVIIPVAAIAIGLAGFPLFLNGMAVRKPARVVAATGCAMTVVAARG
jgi:hypothetical protein